MKSNINMYTFICL